MLETKEFKAWHRLEVAKRTGEYERVMQEVAKRTGEYERVMQEVEHRVEELMNEKNIKVETYAPKEE